MGRVNALLVGCPLLAPPRYVRTVPPAATIILLMQLLVRDEPADHAVEAFVREIKAKA